MRPAGAPRTEQAARAAGRRRQSGAGPGRGRREGGGRGRPARPRPLCARRRPGKRNADAKTRGTATGSVPRRPKAGGLGLRAQGRGPRSARLFVTHPGRGGAGRGPPRRDPRPHAAWHRGLEGSGSSAPPPGRGGRAAFPPRAPRGAAAGPPARRGADARWARPGSQGRPDPPGAGSGAGGASPPPGGWDREGDAGGRGRPPTSKLSTLMGERGSRISASSFLWRLALAPSPGASSGAPGIFPVGGGRLMPLPKPPPGPRPGPAASGPSAAPEPPAPGGAPPGPSAASSSGSGSQRRSEACGCPSGRPARPERRGAGGGVPAPQSDSRRPVRSPAASSLPQGSGRGSGERRRRPGARAAPPSAAPGG